MSRFIAVVLASCLFVSTGAALGGDVGRATGDRAVSGTKSASEAFEGRIVLVSKAALTIVAKNGDNLMFMIATDCKVTRDGKPSSIDMLGAGDRVMIAASNEADRKIANMITARGPERAPSAITRK
jgi:hypothetical protein